MTPPYDRPKMENAGGGSPDFRALNTIVLDLVERVVTLETTGRFTDGQLRDLLQSTTKLSERLGDVAIGLRSVSDLVIRLTAVEGKHQALDTRIDAHDLVFAKTEGGIRATSFISRILWAIIGAGLTGLGIWVKNNSH